MKGGANTVENNDTNTQQNTSNDPKFGVNDNVDANTNPNEDGSKQPKLKKPSFVSLFRENRNEMDIGTLEYIPTGGCVPDFYFSKVAPVEEAHEFCLIGCILGNRPNAFILRQIVKNWGGNIKFRMHINGWITFPFPSAEKRDAILHGGPYLIYGRQLYLKARPTCFLFRVEDMYFVPTWVQLYMDRVTCLRRNDRFARVLVEVNATVTRIRELRITLPTGVPIDLSFIYEGEPNGRQYWNGDVDIVLETTWPNIEEVVPAENDSDTDIKQAATDGDISKDEHVVNHIPTMPKVRKRSKSRSRNKSRDRGHRSRYKSALHSTQHVNETKTASNLHTVTDKAVMKPKISTTKAVIVDGLAAAITSNNVVSDPINANQDHKKIDKKTKGIASANSLGCRKR
ncbi:hypothetical protein F511_12384 [Dorcoceras hygrometricum]|uniref:DUF4283 domain-containing protein n=1 Tax=Dorcoceras hygrometricum TaxID=472368 RepID=A0A2Z7A662_9LAMI|nr:hypothetical protein F511_12384 [Dorcoceras hygrometricum]